MSDDIRRNTKKNKAKKNIQDSEKIRFFANLFAYMKKKQYLCSEFWERGGKAENKQKGQLTFINIIKKIFLNYAYNI